ISLALPAWLHAQGIAQIIPPLLAQSGRLWADLPPWTVILYPYVSGQNGFTIPLADHHWEVFGAALKSVHTAPVPSTLTAQIPRENFGPHWRDRVRAFLEQAATERFTDPIAADVAALLRAERAAIQDTIARAETLAARLGAHPPPFTVCHADIHAGNLLIDAQDRLYIVDWDAPILAPRERDLMFVGGGLGGDGHTPQEEEALFYRGYGPVTIDPVALAYYRYERIIVDIAEFCDQLLLTTAGGDDRARSLHYLRSNFAPDGVLAIARASDRAP
ncbi:MAG: phosphotransferase, partial [Anaerolineae bacterium]|nr:phosphotransferase [Anaerolineae bacterium]